MSDMPPLQQSLYPSSAESEEMLGMRLCVLHNLYFYNNMMTEIRNALDEGNFASYKRAKLAGFEEYDKK